MTVTVDKTTLFFFFVQLKLDKDLAVCPFTGNLPCCDILLILVNLHNPVVDVFTGVCFIFDRILVHTLNLF